MAGLTTAQLEQIRETLATGKRPKVMFTEAAGQIAGQIGQVIQLDDPDVHEEWILVKFGGDALPFAPSDLTIAPKAPPRAKSEPVSAPPAPEPEFMLDKPRTALQERPVSTEPTTPAQPAPGPRKPAAAKAPKVKPLPSFSLTLAYAEGEWTVGAVQGTKALAKPYVIKPAEALQIVGMVDVPGVHEAVEGILAAEREQARSQADRLRAELAELEAKLAELG